MELRGLDFYLFPDFYLWRNDEYLNLGYKEGDVVKAVNLNKKEGG